MAIIDTLNIHYWDVFPRKIKVSLSAWERSVPLSIRGASIDYPEFESTDSTIAWVDSDGVVHLGLQAGATMIMVYDSWERTSVRYVEVEVIDPAVAAAPVWMAWEEQS
ncbi:hypothetical protein KQH29_00355 [bacterium]|nr:hypothetical protein [bacterium]